LSALEILRCAVGSHRLTELTYLGRTYPASEALVLGLVDEVVDDGPVLARATAQAETLAAIPAASFRHTKRQLRAPFQDRIAAGREADDARLAELWTSADLLAAISGYVERVLNRS